jgi:hypothetical protein
MSPAARITTADDFSAPDGKSHEQPASSESNVPIASGRMWSGRRGRHSRRDRLPMLREMRSERLLTSQGLFREPADDGNRFGAQEQLVVSVRRQRVARP